ncbi:hypothetical protein EVAR_46309_1 [Eumeta japonica]|uniref:Uncharacterized protein n=1 Tax=Eumeta variegata TaxID=151549 RepID=A0A4C1XX48_EUMVA|nr:hypothetical protein EVAR_46309_1 [Eumeta japonica]
MDSTDEIVSRICHNALRRDCSFDLTRNVVAESNKIGNNNYFLHRAAARAPANSQGRRSLVRRRRFRVALQGSVCNFIFRYTISRTYILTYFCKVEQGTRVAPAWYVEPRPYVRTRAHTCLTRLALVIRKEASPVSGINYFNVTLKRQTTVSPVGRVPPIILWDVVSGPRRRGRSARPPLVINH